MRATCRSISRVWMISLALAMMLVSAISTSAQDAAVGDIKPVVQDWTTHHVVFSHPGTATDAIRTGNYERWLKIVTDPRYIMQQQRRSAHASVPAAMRSAVTESALRARAEADIEASEAAAGASEMTLEEREAAQRGNRNLPTGLSRALIPPSSEAALAPSFAPTGGLLPQKFKNRIKKDWSLDMGSGATVGLGDFPATYATGTNCSTDFAVFNTGLTASSSQASIVAYNKLYLACGAPTTYWAYNTGGTIINGMDLSPDGSQVAFVQSNGSGVASLVLLKWASGGTLTSPVTPTSVSNANYRTACTPLPCMTTITLSGSPSDTYSFPYYDYGSDTIYVGDDGGKLHKFTSIFRSGTPAEAGSPWPVTVFPTTGLAALGSPVYDSVSQKVFIGDYLLNSSSTCEPSATALDGSCGYLYSVTSSGTTVVQSHELDYNIGILDSPIVDSSAGTVYVFVGADDSNSCAPLSASPCAGVFQFSVGFGAGTSGTEAKVGPGYEFMMSGTFDNAYFTSSTGHLYVVGNTGPADNTLYQIPITSGVMGTTAVVGPVVSTNYDNSYYAAGLQVTEFFNVSKDYIFLSVLAFGNPTSACGTASLANGCILGYDVTSGVINSGTLPTGGLAEAGGTSGIVVDNAASGASNIYFSTLLNQVCTGGTGGCAIQTIQSAP